MATGPGYYCSGTDPVKSRAMVADQSMPEQTHRWNPRPMERLIWVVSGLALFVVLFGVYSNIALDGDTITIGFDDLVIAILSINALWLLHQFLHGFVMARFGGAPAYRLAWLGKTVPVAQVSSAGAEFTRGQFALIVALPFLVISGAGIVAVAILTGKSALPLALAVHGGLCARDLWSMGVAWRQPAGTVFRLEQDGLWFGTPANETGAA